MSAAHAATCGVAIDVPLRIPYPYAGWAPLFVAIVLAIETPGAEMSTVSFRVEKLATVSVRSVAPTPMTPVHAAGASTRLLVAPLLPAAATTTTPAWFAAVIEAWRSGKEKAQAAGIAPPRLKLITRAP
jgi:hypothetical protein